MKARIKKTGEMVEVYGYLCNLRNKENGETYAICDKVENVELLPDDNKVEDKRPITERIKTFADARKVLGELHPLVAEWKRLVDNTNTATRLSKDLNAYLQLRIISAALNEGWRPIFNNSDYLYYPKFRIYSQQDIDEMTPEMKGNVPLFGGYAHSGAAAGLGCQGSYNAWSDAIARISSRLAFKSAELAKYCGKQFIGLWADYLLG